MQFENAFTNTDMYLIMFLKISRKILSVEIIKAKKRRDKTVFMVLKIDLHS